MLLLYLAYHMNLSTFMDIGLNNNYYYHYYYFTRSAFSATHVIIVSANKYKIGLLFIVQLLQMIELLLFVNMAVLGYY